LIFQKDRVITLAELTPLVKSAALHFTPQSGYLLIQGGRFGVSQVTFVYYYYFYSDLIFLKKTWSRLWFEMKSFESHEVSIHRDEDVAASTIFFCENHFNANPNTAQGKGWKNGAL